MLKDLEELEFETEKKDLKPVLLGIVLGSRGGRLWCGVRSKGPQEQD